jgi:hypothetical protein
VKLCLSIHFTEAAFTIKARSFYSRFECDSLLTHPDAAAGVSSLTALLVLLLLASPLLLLLCC